LASLDKKYAKSKQIAHFLKTLSPETFAGSVNRIGQMSNHFAKDLRIVDLAESIAT
jgi:hypothetical protein